MKKHGDGSVIQIKEVVLSDHARTRMGSRGFSREVLEAVVRYGRVARVRDATIYAIGRKEVDASKKMGIDLTRFEGVHVVCTPGGVVLTMYRNHDFRGLRPRPKRRRGRSGRKGDRWRQKQAS